MIFSSVIKIFRINEWYASKVPMLISATLYIFVEKHTKFSADNLSALIVLLIFYSFFLSFGYIINDYSDIEADKKVGKVKIIHGFSKKTAILLVVMTAIAGCVPVLIYKFDLITCLLLLLIYFFGASYSAPPLRFKERGIMGLIISSSAQRCFPLFLAYKLQEIKFDIFFMLWIILGFVVGLRYILVHQYIDMENDKKSDIKTFTLKNEKIVFVLIPAVFIVEIILNIILYIPICARHTWVIGILLFYILVSVVRWKGIEVVFKHKALYSFEQMPLEDFYNQYTPFILNIVLIQYDIRWLILMVLWGIFLLYPTLIHINFPITFVIRNLKRR